MLNAIDLIRQAQGRFDTMERMLRVLNVKLETLQGMIRSQQMQADKIQEQLREIKR